MKHYVKVESCPHCGSNLLVCHVPDCRRPLQSATLCRTHYQRKKRYGSVQADIPIRSYAKAA